MIFSSYFAALAEYNALTPLRAMGDDFVEFGPMEHIRLQPAFMMHFTQCHTLA